MKSILVNTSHNITIKYELASVMHRALACFIDLLVLLFYMILVSSIVSSDGLSYYFFLLLVPGFYHLFCEVLLNGQSLGKKALKIRVVTLTGKKPTMENYFLRWIFRSIEVLGSLGALAAISIASTDKNQRIGDLLAETTVVKVIPENTVSLDTLKGLAYKERDIQYQGVTRYTDKDMLLVKEVLQRLRTDRSAVNRDFGLQLAERISTDLEVEISGSKAKFLEDVLIDYIFLTR